MLLPNVIMAPASRLHNIAAMSTWSGVAFHIMAGSLGLLSGAAAMALPKGSRPHRAAGNVFFVSMLAMAASAIYLAILKPAMASAVEGMLVFYLVATGWLTVMRREGRVGVLEHITLFLGLATVTAGVTFGVAARNAPAGLLDGIPAAFYFFFAGLAAVAVAFDVKVLMRGGISGAQRITRHLWRMATALTLASANLFIGLPQVFPAGVRETHLLPAPVVLAFALLIYWLVRVRFTNWYARSS